MELASISRVKTDEILDWYQNITNDYHDTLQEAKDEVSRVLAGETS
jgi:hypothetical protein